jgi:hypothetical protein
VVFLDELRGLQPLCDEPWLLCRDFNLIYMASDKSNSRLNHPMMGKFHRFLQDMESCLRFIFMVAFSRGVMSKLTPRCQGLTKPSLTLRGVTFSLTITFALAPRRWRIMHRSYYTQTYVLWPRRCCSASRQSGPSSRATWTQCQGHGMMSFRTLTRSALWIASCVARRMRSRAGVQNLWGVFACS